MRGGPNLLISPNLKCDCSPSRSLKYRIQNSEFVGGIRSAANGSPLREQSLFKFGEINRFASPPQNPNLLNFLGDTFFFQRIFIFPLQKKKKRRRRSTPKNFFEKKKYGCRIRIFSHFLCQKTIFFSRRLRRLGILFFFGACGDSFFFL